MSEEQVDYQTGEILAGRFDWSNLGNVAKRVAAAALKVGTVEKRGRNQHFQYNYATAEDIKRAARTALANEGVAVFPLMRGVEQNGKLTRVHFDFVVACEDGHLVVPWSADAQDSGDKGISKCTTVAMKYFLISLLQIPTGDEDDPDGDGTPAGEKKPRPSQKRKTQPKTAQPKTTQPKAKNDNGGGHSWPAQIVAGVVSEGYAEHARHAVNMLNRSAKLTPEMDAETAVAWAATYRAARDGGSDEDGAVATADATLE